MPERYATYDGGRVYVDLPKDTKYSERNPSVDKDTSVVVSLPNENSIHVGKDRRELRREDFADKLKQVLQNHSEPDQRVYLAAAADNSYDSIVKVIDEIRRQGVSRVGLLVLRQKSDGPNIFAIEIPAEPDPNEDLRLMKPNPLTLVVSVTPDLKVRLNQNDYGSVNDLEPLSTKLVQVFRLREEQFAIKPGFENRSDLPLSERIEKTLVIKANRSIKYGDLIKIIDAVKGAGAFPIMLQIDDLSL